MWVCPADSARNVSLYHNFRAVDRCDDGGWRLDVPASVGRLNTFSVFGVWFPDSKPGDLTYMSVTDSEGDASGLNRSGMASGDVSVQLPWPGGSAVVSCMRRAVAGHRSFWTPANDASLSTGHVSGASGFSGCVGDVALFSRVLSPFECARVESVLALRYGITLDHSYYLGEDLVIDRDLTGSPYRIFGIGNRPDVGFVQHRAYSLCNLGNDSFVSQGSFAGNSPLGLRRRDLPVSIAWSLSGTSPEGSHAILGDNGGAYTMVHQHLMQWNLWIVQNSYVEY